MEVSENANRALESGGSEAAKHIRTLNGINNDITAALAKAGNAIALLTSKPPSSSQASSQQSRQDAFQETTREYYAHLKSVRDKLVAEVDALEEAGLVKPDKASETNEPGVTNGGMGSLDIGWLNARSRDVGIAKEAELLKEARALLEKLAREKKGINNQGDVEMGETDA